MRPAETLALRTLADARAQMLCFALLFAGIAVAHSAGYRNTYPTLADRLQFAQSFGDNKAARLFYGTPHQLETIGGYTAWRAGGVLSLFAAFFGLLAAVRALRGEEDAGRQELVAAGAITRGAAFAARIVAIGATIAGLWLATVAGLVAGGLPAPGSTFLAVSTVSAAAVYGGGGALTSQLLPSRRGALELGGAFFGLDFLLRVVSDTANVQAVHWVSPLGWVEELRPFADPRPAVLMLPAVASAALLALARVLERRRDVGLGVFVQHDVARRSHLRLLRSPTLLALRSEWISLAVWAAAAGGFAFVVGTISKSVTSAGLSANLQQQLHKVGGIQIATASGYMALTFLFFALAVALFCCGQLAASRGEEAAGRLETLFALPQSRTGWLAGSDSRSAAQPSSPSRPGSARRSVRPRSAPTCPSRVCSRPASTAFRRASASSASARCSSLCCHATESARPTRWSASRSCGSSSARCSARPHGCSASRRSIRSGSCLPTRSEPARRPSWSESVPWRRRERGRASVLKT